MTAAEETPSYHQPFISQPPQYVIVLPPYPRRHRTTWRRRLAISLSTVSFLFLLAAAYVFWPSDPDLTVAHLSLNRLQFHAQPLSIDAELDLTIRIRNRDFYSIDYDSLVVGIRYRGNKLGSATSDGGRVEPRGYSCVKATLRLDAVEVLSDVILLLEDLATGSIAFDTVSEIKANLGVFSFDLPLKAKISCEVVVNTRNQTITHQNCYPLLSQSKLGNAATCVSSSAN